MASGRKTSGRRDVSVTDVAEHAKVSVGTVSRVINRHPDVNPELRKRVLMSSRRLGFVPKVEHRCIAVITGRMSPVSPVNYVTTMIGLIARELAARKYTMELVDVENLDLAYQAHVQGVIGVVFDERFASLTTIPNLPIMTLNWPMLERGIHSVATDHFQQSFLATEHLLDRGHRQIAYLENEGGVWGSDQRLEGYRAALEKAGVPFDPSLVQHLVNQPVYDVLARLVKRGIKAMLNFSEDYCLETVHILTNILGLRIPRDVSVVTMENLPVFQYLTPPHTIVRQPLEEMVRLAVEKMTGLCEFEGAERRELVNVMLPNELIERDSVARTEDGR